MSEPRITVLIVNYNSAEFVLTSLYCLKRLTRGSYRVVVADNNSPDPEDYRKLEDGVLGEPNVFCYRKEGFGLTGSMAHGTTLNEMVEEFVDTPYFCVLDADATWLYPGWDDLSISHLSDSVKIIGTEASGDKPKDFPLMYAMVFETATFRELAIDFRPKDIEAKQDTGFEMREKYLSAGYKGAQFSSRNTREYQEGPFRSLLGVMEYYLDDEAAIIASHFGRGSTLGASKFMSSRERVLYMLPFVGPALRKRRGLSEKREWCRIARDIADANAL